MSLLRWLVARWNRLESKTQPAAKPHVHRWRYVIKDEDDFGHVRQCTDRKCGEVEILGDVAEGVQIYMDLMTSYAAKTDPIGQASDYVRLAPEAAGERCQKCERILPEGYKTCIYCRRLEDGTDC